MSCQSKLMEKYQIRDARPSDCSEIYRLIYDLAVYEKMPEKVDITPDKLAEDAFGPNHPPRFFALVVELLDPETQNPIETVGYSIYNEIYSTFRGRTLWIEDIYIADAHRSRGLAGGVMRKLVARADRDNLAGIEWNVLGWNQLAIGFYKNIGANDITEGENGWNLYRWTREKYTEYLKMPFQREATISIE